MKEEDQASHNEGSSLIIIQYEARVSYIIITINEGSRLSLIIINEEANKRLEPHYY